MKKYFKYILMMMVFVPCAVVLAACGKQAPKPTVTGMKIYINDNEYSETNKTINVTWGEYNIDNIVVVKLLYSNGKESKLTRDKAGSYSIGIAGKPSYEESIDAGSYEFVITYQAESYPLAVNVEQASVAKPVETQGTIVYDGEEHRGVTYFAGSEIVLGSVEKATNAGTYNTQVEPDRNHKWSDGTRDILNYNWTIERASVAMPTVKQDLVYTGEEVVGVNYNNEDNAGYSVVGGSCVKAVKEGSYEAIFTLDSNHKWANAEQGKELQDVVLSWTLGRASNLWVTTLSIANYNYGGKPNPAAESKYGTVQYRYTKIVDGSPVAVADMTNALPGIYNVYAWVEATDDYLGLTEIMATFEINPADYSGSVTAPTGLSGVEGATLASVSLGEHFAWKNPETVLLAGTHTYTALYNEDATLYNNKEVEVNVFAVALNSWEQALTIANYNYGSMPNPTAESAHGTVQYRYTKIVDGSPVAVSDMTNALPGTYKVYAWVEATDEYLGLTEVSAEFSVLKLDYTGSVTLPEGLEGYATDELSSIELPANMVWADDTEMIEEGTHTYTALYNEDATIYNDKEVEITIVGLNYKKVSNLAELKALAEEVDSYLSISTFALTKSAYVVPNVKLMGEVNEDYDGKVVFLIDEDYEIPAYWTTDKLLVEDGIIFDVAEGCELAVHHNYIDVIFDHMAEDGLNGEIVGIVETVEDIDKLAGATTYLKLVTDLTIEEDTLVVKYRNPFESVDYGYLMIDYNGHTIKDADDQEVEVVLTVYDKTAGDYVESDALEQVDQTVKYTVEFYVDADMTASQEVVKGRTPEMIKTPEKSGYTFEAWYQAGSEEAYDFNAPLTSDVKLYAKFVVNNGYVQVITANGLQTSDSVVTFGEGVTLTWSEANLAIGRGVAGYWAGIKMVAPYDLDLANAQYKNKPDGAFKNFLTYADGDKTYIELWGVVSESTYTRLKNEGQLTYKWYFDWDGDGVVDQTAQLIITDQVNLATHNGEISVITANGVKSGNVVTFGEDVTLSWSQSNPVIGRGVDGYWAGIKMFAPKCMDLTKAQYKSSSTGAFKNFLTYADGDKSYIELWGVVSTKTVDLLYTYGQMTYSWYFDWDGDGVVDQTAQLVITDDIAYSGHNVNIEYNMNGVGKQVETEVIEGVGKATQPANPVASGYTFLGWYADSEYKTEFNFDAYRVVDATVYAKWEAIGATELVCYTAGGVVDNAFGYQRALFNNVQLNWVKADASVGRNVDGYWVGAKVTAPAGADLDNAYYVDLYHPETKKSFAEHKDGTDYIGLWAKLDQNILDKAVKDGAPDLYYCYGFDWNNDGALDAYILIDVVVNGVTLRHDMSNVSYVVEEGVAYRVETCADCGYVVKTEVEDAIYATPADANTLINSAEAGSIVVLTPGTYDRLEFQNPNNNSDNITILGSEGVYVNQFYTTVHEGTLNNLTIKDITFTQKGIGTNNIDVNNLTVENCNFVGTEGICLGDNVITNLVVKNCTFNFSDEAISTVTAVYVQKTNGLTVENCTFENIPYNAIQSNSSCQGDIVIKNNRFVSVGSRIIYIGGLKNATLANVVIEGNEFSMPTNPKSDGNYVKAGATFTISSNNTWNIDTDKDMSYYFEGAVVEM